MRLPTKDEALAIAGVTYTSCAWPAGWITWTSTNSAALAWLVASDGRADEMMATIDRPALCVR